MKRFVTSHPYDRTDISPAAMASRSAAPILEPARRRNLRQHQDDGSPLANVHYPRLARFVLQNPGESSRLSILLAIPKIGGLRNKSRFARMYSLSSSGN